MDRVFDWVLMTFVFLTITVVVIMLGYAVYDLLVAETFELRKDAWTCTKVPQETTTTIMPIGKAILPMVSTNNVCDQWTAK